MIDLETFSVAFINIKNQKLRSYLTFLGIIIGIAAIISLISIVQGMQVFITGELQSLGLDSIFVEPGSGTGISTVVARTLTSDDIETIRGIQGVKDATGFWETSAILDFKGQQAEVILVGMEPDKMYLLEQMGYVDIIEGREFTKTDKFSIGLYEDFAKDTFDTEIKLRENVELNGKKFRVIALSKSSAFLSAFGGTSMVLVTDTVVKEFFGEEDPVEIIVMVDDGADIKEVQARIDKRLEKKHGTKDFYTMTSENLLEGADTILGLVGLIVLAIAGISLVVGGIGIMNTMLMSVMERTREIGVMKAIGASTNTILLLFLVESGLIGLIGGIIGVIIGALMALSASAIASYAGFPFNAFPSVELIAGGLFFSLIVGMISGWIPAQRAAKMDPVEALRFE
ncbi:ABC transporter permease [Candidatus Micrarchaeota archaeon]|nr:ABC transporter permease [Candidatus Micrarchaeota archaeon]